jgi:hypothetical protein
MYKRNLLVCGIILVGFLTAPLAWADKGHPASVEVSPREPIQIFGAGQGTPGEGDPSTGTPAIIQFFDNVPDGQRLVMQHISLKTLTGFADEVNVTCRLEVDTGFLDLEVALDLIVIKYEGSVNSFIAQGPITLYAEAGDEVRAICSGRNELNRRIVTQTLGTLVGYLVKVKQPKQPKQPKQHDDD